ncbi:efflux RND transporter periplasmic adaptor subunit [Aquimarina celericrescens]|uniref:Efflux RND transporter periplasmic adaptor subunit n=1 Tax=Aquimarina celericrescens TaxID=1964542 RepID=A0ABW5AXW7_9FLAO|nr:efflux RND transporter periplasmic adaptor subunit [Aquimarina celericrescens]
MKRTIHIIFILGILLSLWNCGEKNNQSKETVTEVIDDRIQVTEAQFEQSNMTLGSLEEKLFPTVINVNGMIDVPPENRALVSAQVGGYIKKLPLLIGDKVYKGQVLITIENPEFVIMQQEYLEVKEQLAYLKAEYDRQQTMQAENITSQKSFLKAESAYKMAIAKQTSLAKQLRMLNISPAKVEAGNFSSVTTIYAPISGSITKVNVTKGSYVSPATAILEIVDNKHIHLELSVFEKDIMNVKKGQKISFKIPEASLETYKAQVYLVGTAIENNRTIKVHAHLEDESHNNFLTGMFVEASIITDSTLAKALPSEALVTVDDVSSVLILDTKEEDIYYFKQQEVNVQATYDGYSRIENPDIFGSNVQFLTKGAFNLIGE